MALSISKFSAGFFMYIVSFLSFALANDLNHWRRPNCSIVNVPWSPNFFLVLALIIFCIAYHASVVLSSHHFLDPSPMIAFATSLADCHSWIKFCNKPYSTISELVINFSVTILLYKCCAFWASESWLYDDFIGCG